MESNSFVVGIRSYAPNRVFRSMHHWMIDGMLLAVPASEIESSSIERTDGQKKSFLLVSDSRSANIFHCNPQGTNQ
jgi:hypothetical protein